KRPPPQFGTRGRNIPPRFPVPMLLYPPAARLTGLLGDAGVVAGPLLGFPGQLGLFLDAPIPPHQDGLALCPPPSLPPARLGRPDRAFISFADHDLCRHTRAFVSFQGVTPTPQFFSQLSLKVASSLVIVELCGAG